MAQSILSSRGRTTVPADVRAALHIRPGSCLQWQVTSDGDVIVRVKTISTVELPGPTKHGKPIDIEDSKP
ncbi:AbrB/MazE/SpoVT family DNA-binding domain-containing protein [Paraburkholderia caribensis]|uniref:AbrB/MazE/SpoVT family DNA-binding domain-containing protein n=1 Tax=Paraburkholderia caribensis TaxID=75105 RepID=UPI00398A5F78